MSRRVSQTPPRRCVRRRGGEPGQIIVLFALALIIVLGMVAVSVDGGYGLVQYRRAQNAADFASVAGTKVLTSLCRGGNPPANQQVYNEIQDVINQNSSAVSGSWTATYVDGGGSPIVNPGTGKPYAVDNTSNAPPPTACGVTVQTSPSWTPFIAGILGKGSLTTNATAKSVLNPALGQSVGIVALDEINPHEVLGGGQGTFNVYGTIFANASVPYDPWTQTHNGHKYNDVVDAKDNSNLILHGIMETVSASWPLDWCFGVKASGADTGTLFNATPPTNPPVPDPYNTAICSGGTGSNTVVLKYNQIVNNQSQITDPLLPAANGAGGVPDPFDNTSQNPGYTQGLCPGQVRPQLHNSVPAAVGGVTLLQPGDYTVPVSLTGSVQFADCSAVYNPSSTSTASYPGVFRFEKGLTLQPAAGKTVQGNNVLIATGSPVAIAGNVPGATVSGQFTPSGTGNGAPCFPAGVVTAQSKPQTDGTHQCGGTSGLPNGPYYGVTSYNQSNYLVDPLGYGTGTNFSLILGGAGSITLSAPTTGVFRDIALFQERSVPGNFALDAQPNDSATVTVNGLVYDASLACYGFPYVESSTTCSTLATKPAANPFDYWDVGITFRNGGTLQAGVGTGGGYPMTSSGSVTINGPCVVSDFNTDGNTTITIDGRQNQFNLPGVLGSGNPPVVG